MFERVKRWILREVEIDKTKNLELDELLFKLLLKRGFLEKDKIENFLYPKIENLDSPFLLKDMEKAIDRIQKAIKDQEKIIIYGDYDVDGISSTSILYMFLKSINSNVGYFIPKRDIHGYGLTKEAILEVVKYEPNLVITVDCGISSVEEIEMLKLNNIDVIITDHHEVGDIVPNAYAVVNPHQKDCNYAFKDLCGAGVAFKLISAFCIKNNISDFEKYLDIVSIATIADVVKLHGENRVLAKHGIVKIKTTDNMGIKALIQKSGLSRIDSQSIAFILAPRINAAGRLGDASKAVEMLITEDLEIANINAQVLCDENKRRQQIELEIFEEAINSIENDYEKNSKEAIVVAGESWNYGVVGIVASRIVERYYRPCFIISYDSEGNGRGSARSIKGFNIFECLKYCSKFLTRYGGHELAGGFSIEKDKVLDFKRCIKEYSKNVMTNDMIEEKLYIDLNLTNYTITVENIEKLQLLSPFGEANPAPIFLFEDFQIIKIYLIGNGKHIKIFLKKDQNYYEAIAFNRPQLIEEYKINDFVDCVCCLDINEWNGKRSIVLQIKDIRFSKKILLSNYYYLSLDKTIKRDMVKNNIEELVKTKNIKIDINIFEELLLNSISKKVAIIINTLSEIKKLEDIFKKLSIKTKLDYYYSINKAKLLNIGNISVLINPSISNLEDNFEQYFIYGEWFSLEYLSNILLAIDDEKLFIYNYINKSSLKAHFLVPSRDDITLIYNYIKTKENFCEVSKKDIFVLVDEINKIKQCKMNYFKFVKCIQILEELLLIEAKEYDDKYILKIIFSQEKKDLNNSILFNKLLSLNNILC